MAGNEALYLVLGCFGRRDDNFISCLSVENRILKVDHTIEGYDKMMDYLAGCRLFDKPLFDVNAVRHLVFHLQDSFDQKFKRLWPEKNFTLYQKFLLDHRGCGVYIKLILVDENNDTGKLEPEPEKIFIKGTKKEESDNMNESDKIAGLRLIKNRR